MKILYLLRHAKAEAGGARMADIDRPLSARGLEACLALGDYFRLKRYQPDFALVSPSLRTRQTLERIMQAAGQTPRVRQVKKLYLAGEEEMLRIVQDMEEDAPSLLLVGHNPGMHQAGLSLASPEPTLLRDQLELKYPPGALCVLRFDCGRWRDAAHGQGRLIDFMTPKEL